MQTRQQSIPLARPFKLKGKGRDDAPVLRTLADAAFFLSATYNGAVVDGRAKALASEIHVASRSGEAEAINAVSEHLERFLADRRLI